MANFLPNLSDRKGRETMPMIWPTEAREFQVAMTEEVRYCSPAELVAVANWRTKPGLAMMLPMILIEPVLVCLQEGVDSEFGTHPI